MRRTILIVLWTCSFLMMGGRRCPPYGFAGTALAQEDPFDQALAKVGLTRETLRFDDDDMANFGGDKFLLPLFTTLHRNPLKIPDYTRVFRDAVIQNAGSLENMLTFASLRLKAGVRRNLVANPIAGAVEKSKEPEALYQSILALYAKDGRSLRGEEKAQIQKRCSQVPVELANLIAVFVYTTVSSKGYLDEAFAEAHDLPMNKIRNQALRLLVADSDLTTPQFERFAEKVDFPYLYAGAEDLAWAVDLISDSLSRLTVLLQHNLTISTPWGVIAVNGTGNDLVTEDHPYLLIIDLGGDDTYQTGGATTRSEQPASVLIDLAGNDRYVNSDSLRPAFGAGVFGYGFLVDLGGNDQYESVNNSLGVGLFGFGTLLDKSGNDQYRARTTSQGAGIFGIGLLSDLDGDDRYYACLAAQGFGYTKGCGILVDLRGSDEYVADDSTVVFPSAQTKEHNDSMCQGVGFGRRADITDGHSWAGGLGFLVDAAGDDRYSAGLFAQGCAYWYGVGILADQAGNDTYHGVWYVQGSGAHFGVGILDDVAGNDHYTATMNMAQGAGHDFTVGFLIEEAGDDTYQAPNLSLGGGNDNGIGIFWDKEGNDTYEVSAATTLGRANITAPRGGLRDLMLCLGLFIDSGGNDTYSKDFAKNNTVWTQKGLNTDRPLSAEKGVGIDCEWK